MSSAEQATENLFSYGTLKLEDVQLETFGRKLHSQPDALRGYKLVMITITDDAFVVKSGAANHRTLQFTGNSSDVVEGAVELVVVGPDALAAHAREIGWRDVSKREREISHGMPHPGRAARAWRRWRRGWRWARPR